MKYEDALALLLELAERHGGTLVAANVETNETLASDRALASAAARALAGRTDVVGVEASGRRTWFPYSTMEFKTLQDSPASWSSRSRGAHTHVTSKPRASRGTQTSCERGRRW